MYHLTRAGIIKKCAELFQEAEKEIQKIFDEGLYEHLKPKRQIKVLEAYAASAHAQKHFTIARERYLRILQAFHLRDVCKEEEQTFIQERIFACTQQDEKVIWTNPTGWEDV